MNKVLMVFVLIASLVLSSCSMQTAQTSKANEEFSIVGEWVIDSIVLTDDGEETIVPVDELAEFCLEHFSQNDYDTGITDEDIKEAEELEQQFKEIKIIFFDDGVFAITSPDNFDDFYPNSIGTYTIAGSTIKWSIDEYTMGGKTTKLTEKENFFWHIQDELIVDETMDKYAIYRLRKFN